MNFYDMIIDDLQEKYANMLEGKTTRQNNDVIIKDIGEFLSNYKALTDRLQVEIKEINDGLAKIKNNRSSRIKAENDEKIRKKRATEEAKEREEMAIRDAAYAAKAKSESVETFFQAVALASPVSLTKIWGIILLLNMEKISTVFDFSRWWSVWVYCTVVCWFASIVFLKKRFDDWRVDDIASRVSSTIVAIIAILCSVIVFLKLCKAIF